MCVLSSAASALLSLLLSPCVRQSLNLAELPWEERQDGGRKEDHGRLGVCPLMFFLVPLSSSVPSHDLSLSCDDAALSPLDDTSALSPP